MRSLLVVCLVACVALVAGTANAAGQISDNTLAQMGIAGLQTMSDIQGTEIRGMGFAAVAGTNKAVLGGTVAKNSYVAVSAPKHGSALAAGASVGIAAGGIGVFPPFGSPSGVVVGTIAVGGAVAWAK
jgi:hypothetical protein